MNGASTTGSFHSRDGLCVQDLVQLQAKATPTAVAVVSGNDHLTYGELNTRAHNLAHHLRSLGVGAEVPVGLCMELVSGIADCGIRHPKSWRGLRGLGSSRKSFNDCPCFWKNREL